MSQNNARRPDPPNFLSCFFPTVTPGYGWVARKKPSIQSEHDTGTHRYAGFFRFVSYRPLGYGD